MTFLKVSWVHQNQAFYALALFISLPIIDDPSPFMGLHLSTWWKSLKKVREVMSQNTMLQMLVMPTPEGGRYKATEVQIPVPGAGEVLIQVKASSVNRGETQSVLKHKDPSAKPLVTGIEFAGVIFAVGKDVQGWKVGDEVMTRSPAGFAQFAIAPVKSLMKKPSSVSWLEAGCIPNVFITAHDALVTAGNIKNAQSVLVTAGSSGVGVTGIQMARYFGINQVFATTRSDHKIASLKALGASAVFNTEDPKWVDELLALTGNQGVDLIMDQVGSSLFDANMKALALGGRIITVGRNAGSMANINLDELARKNASVIGRTFRTRTLSQTQECSRRFDEDCAVGVANGSIKVILDRSFKFTQLDEAQAYLMSNGQTGKIAIEVS
jgi:NADPH2:quinone reductase